MEIYFTEEQRLDPELAATENTSGMALVILERTRNAVNKEVYRPKRHDEL